MRRIKNVLIVMSAVVTVGLFLHETIYATDGYYRKVDHPVNGEYYEYVTERTEKAVAISDCEFVTSDGNIWLMDDHDLVKGKKYRVVISDNATPDDVTDDVVEDIR